MIYGSVCSGIEAATVAWHPLGWKPAFFSEIEKFPRAVLAHHYPEVPLHGDFTTIEEKQYGAIDLIVGGTPCQSFSIAGLRGGLDDDRGNLAIEFIRLAERKRARWLLWENVPGVFSSNKGKDFQSFVSGLVGWVVPIPKGGWANTGIVSPVPGRWGLAWRVFDAQYFGVPQRRRRVFLVAYLGDWRPPAAVLFERESLRRNSPPSREKGKRIASAFETGTSGSRFTDLAPTLDTRCKDGPIRNQLGIGVFQQDSTGEPDVIAFSCKDYGNDVQTDVTPTMRSMNSRRGQQNGGGQLAIHIVEGDSAASTPDLPRLRAGVGRGEETAIAISESQTGYVRESDITQALGCAGGKVGQGYQAVRQANTVRRLTPRECERLQGFPDDYTLIPYRGKPAADCPDGPRYKALGNSMAVPVMHWIGQRVQAVDEIINSQGR